MLRYTICFTLRFAVSVLRYSVVRFGLQQERRQYISTSPMRLIRTTARIPVCLWQEPVKFPVQADTSDTSKTSGYDALVDQGLLVRTTAEKKKLIIASKQMNNYDLSDKGAQRGRRTCNNPGSEISATGKPEGRQHRYIDANDEQCGCDDSGELSLQLFWCSGMGDRGRDTECLSSDSRRSRWIAARAGDT